VRTRTTIYLEEDSQEWLKRRVAIDGKKQTILLNEAVKMYAIVLDRAVLESLFADQSEAIRQTLLDYRDTACAVPLPQTFED